MKSGKKYLWFFVPALFFALLLSVGVYLNSHSYQNEAKEKYLLEEDCINDYLQNLQPTEKSKDETETQEGKAEEETKAETKMLGSGSVYDGVIECVLQIDSIELKKLVVKGNQDYNLEHFLLCATLLDAKLGDTAYAIIGHNSYVYGNSFNRLHEVKKGDEIRLISNTGDYFYYVESLKQTSYKEIAKEIIYTDPSYLYLYTCGEGQDEEGMNNLLFVVARNTDYKRKK